MSNALEQKVLEANKNYASHFQLGDIIIKPANKLVIGEFSFTDELYLLLWISASNGFC